MAFLDFGRTEGRCLPRARIPVRNATVSDQRQSTWLPAAIKIGETFLVLTGIAVATLTLRFALVLLYGNLQ
jgi:hypothetical protein